MQKIIIIFFSILIVGSMAGSFYLQHKKSNNYLSYESGSEAGSVNLNGKIFKIEVASTPAERSQGLSGRNGICRDCAMLFEFQNQGVYPFWMKDMRFDLDIIWISGTSVVFIERSATFQDGTTRVINPGVLADKVLEINSGLSDEIHIKVGDKISFLEI